MFDNILLAVDGSEHALHAACMAAKLAKAMNSQTLRIVVAYEPVPAYLGEPNLQHVIDVRLNEAQHVLQETVETLGPLSTDVHTELIEGDAADSIIEVARTRASDLIVMGSRGLSRLAELVLGSTSQKVVAHAPCPVLIVR
jgi:nucleotide-binding universal stress UspA family protein